MSSASGESNWELLPVRRESQTPPPAAEADEGLALGALPKELGVMLISAGVLGFVMPGPGTPAIVAGGMVLWPEQFEKFEAWFKRRFPRAHRGGMGHIRRYLDDLERRYPGSLTEPTPGRPSQSKGPE